MSVGLDLESRSRINLKKLGSYRYIEDPSTVPLCLAYAFDEDAPKLWKPGDRDPTDLLDYIENNGEVSGWNIGGFDCPFWNRILVRDYGWPVIRVKQQVDTMAMAAAMNLPQKLAVCAKEIGMPLDKQKDKRGTYLIQRLCVPKIRRKGGLPIEEYFVDDPQLMWELYDYCRQDVVTERALAKKLKPLPALERRFWQITQVINARGVPIDIAEIKRIKKVVEREKEHLNRRAVKIADGAFEEMSQLEKVKAWIRSEGVDVDSMDKEHVAELLDTDLPDNVRKVIKIHSEINQVSIAKYDTMLARVCEDDTLKGEIVYHGASTGRDASRGINLQNVANPPRSCSEPEQIAIAHEVLGTGDWEWARLNYGGDLLGAAVACVRGVLRAPKGYRWLDVDYSSIENRIGSWIAGHRAKLRMFESGLDEYKTFAVTMFGIPYEEVTKDQRKFCKPIILGGIFGQGWRGMIDYAKKYGVELSEEEAQQAIETFRADYKPIQKMWYACGDAAIQAVLEPGRKFQVGEHLVFKSDNRFLMMRLPSGRVLRWYAPRVESKATPWGEMRDVVTAMGIDTFTRKWQRSKIIGSSFFQSSVQATAADIMRHGCISLEDAGYPLRMRIHDEFLCLMRNGKGSVEEMLSIIRKTPDWARGLPINGEGWEGPRFKKG